MEDFLVALKSPEWKTEIPANKRDILLTRAKESRVQAVTFQDFVNVVSTFKMASDYLMSDVLNNFEGYFYTFSTNDKIL